MSVKSLKHFSASPVEILLHLLLKVKISGKIWDYTWSWIIGTIIQQFTDAIKGGGLQLDVDPDCVLELYH